MKSGSAEENVEAHPPARRSQCRALTLTLGFEFWEFLVIVSLVIFRRDG
jgi:hypothetical protein